MAGWVSRWIAALGARLRGRGALADQGAERDGVVKTIRAKPGDSLAVDAVIMEFA